MITTIIGKTFLKAYNEKVGKQYSAKDFFEKKYFELFFNHNKYLMTGGNSAFENPKISWEKMQKGIMPYESAERRKERFNNFISKAGKTEGILDMGIAPGYPAAEITAPTSGQISDIEILNNEDDIYFSWMGAGLGIGVAGGYNLLIDDENILLEIYNGWQHYRKYLNDPSLEKMRGNQINSWNGQWLTYKLSNSFVEDFDFSRLQSEGMVDINDSLIEVNTANWTNLFFSLSNFYPEKNITAYVYSFGQTNKTIGFIPIYLKSGTRLKDVWRQLYGNPEKFDNKEFQSLYGMHIKRACELGSIGLHALRPEGLKKYMNESKNFTFKKEEEIIIYQSYKTWLIAMLSKNKNEIKDYTNKIAKAILEYKNAGKGNSRITLVEEELFKSKSKKEFLDNLIVLCKTIDENDLDTLRDLKDDIHLMTNEEFGYLHTLIRFDYAYEKRISSQNKK